MLPLRRVGVCSHAKKSKKNEKEQTRVVPSYRGYNFINNFVRDQNETAFERLL